MNTYYAPEDTSTIFNNSASRKTKKTFWTFELLRLIPFLYLKLRLCILNFLINLVFKIPAFAFSLKPSMSVYRYRFVF